MATVADILQEAKGFDLLKEVETLLCDYLSVDSSALFLMRPARLTKDVTERIGADIERLKSGYPIAYLRGKADFYGLEFYVNENVLIPRPETEMLVDKTIECIKKLINARDGEQRVSQVKMIELGIGSGCISMAVVKALRSACSASLPGQRFTPDLSQQLAILGIEKSEKAFRVAKKNLNTFAMNDVITFKKGDLLEWVKPGFSYDILVANLPYIAPDDPNVQESVRKYEPHEALFADEGGLALYKKTLEQLNANEMKPKYILFEIGFDQGGRISKMCKDIMPDFDVAILKDLENRDRVVALEKTPIRP